MQSMKKLAVAVALCSAATVHAADIKVGIALDISGPFSALGAEARDGFELAIEKLGAQRVVIALRLPQQARRPAGGIHPH